MTANATIKEALMQEQILQAAKQLYAVHGFAKVTMDDVAKMKPHPEGLYNILRKRDPASALYLGDNVDDALAARDAGVPFAAIISRSEHHYHERAALFRKLGAIALLPRATDVNKLLAKLAPAPTEKTSRKVSRDKTPAR